MIMGAIFALEFADIHIHIESGIVGIIGKYIGEIPCRYTCSNMHWGAAKWRIFITFDAFDNGKYHPYFVFNYSTVKQVIEHVLTLNDLDPDSYQQYTLYQRRVSSGFKRIKNRKRVYQLVPNGEYWISKKTLR